eukprot:SAG31_NODE_6986_length_1826_cov_2.101911_2_plen_94_part_00
MLRGLRVRRWVQRHRCFCFQPQHSRQDALHFAGAGKSGANLGQRVRLGTMPQQRASARKFGVADGASDVQIALRTAERTKGSAKRRAAVGDDY